MTPAGLEIGAGQKLSGSGRIVGDVVNRGLFSPGNSPGIDNVTGDMTFDRAGTVLIEIGGLTPGPGSPTVDNGFDQIKISGHAQFGGTLKIQLINTANFTPQVGQTFDIITYGAKPIFFLERISCGNIPFSVFFKIYFLLKPRNFKGEGIFAVSSKNSWSRYGERSSSA